MPSPPTLLSRLLAPPTRYSLAALRRAVAGRRVLITGASHGIGRALALRLIDSGALVVVAARSLDRLRELGAAGAYHLDLTDPTSVDALSSALGEVDVVVHNAGKSIRRLLFESLDRPHDFERTMAVAYHGPVRLQLALLPAMRERGGHIVNVSSLGVRLPPAPRWAAYTAAKLAFDTWLRAARPELALQHVACTSVYLGLVHTRMSAPTAKYRTLPGQTADQAAATLCRALANRPRVIEPWWLPPLRVLSPWTEGLVDRALQRHLRGELEGPV